MRYCIFCGVEVGDAPGRCELGIKERAHMAFAHSFMSVLTVVINNKLVQEGPWVYTGPDTLSLRLASGGRGLMSIEECKYRNPPLVNGIASYWNIRGSR